MSNPSLTLTPIDSRETKAQIHAMFANKTQISQTHTTWLGGGLLFKNA